MKHALHTIAPLGRHTLAGLLLFVGYAVAWAQTAPLVSDNAAWLRTLETDRVATAQGGVRTEGGGFRDYSDGKHETTGAASSETYMRTSEGRVVLHGEVGYSHTTLRAANGSAFIDPERKPFDLVAVDSTAGTKRLERYDIGGGLAWTTNRLTLGASVHLDAASYAKTRDLRHRNKRMALDLSLGLAYDLGAVEVGANYVYHRSTEGIKFGIYGTQDKTYTTLVSYGTFWGMAEEASTSLGYTQTTRELPLFDQWNGVGGQVRLRLGDNLTLFDDFSYEWHDGYYGLHSPYTAVLSDHEGELVRNTFEAAMRQGDNRYRLTASVARETLRNYARLFRTETDLTTGFNTVRYYGSSGTLEASFNDFALEARGELGTSGGQPRWALCVAYAHHRDDQTAMRFTLTRRTLIRQDEVSLSAQRNFVGEHNDFGAGLGASLRTGGGKPLELGRQEGTAPDTVNLISLDDLRLQHYDYETATLLAARLRLTWLHHFERMALGLDLHYTHLAATNADYCPSGSRDVVQLNLLCQF